MTENLNNILADMLLGKNLITCEQLQEISKQMGSSEYDLTEELISRGMFSENDMLAMLSEKLQLTLVDLKERIIKQSVIDRVPFKIASYYRFMPIDINERTLVIAVRKPLDIKTQDEIRAQLGYEIEIVLSPHDDINACLKKYYGSDIGIMDKITSEITKSDTCLSVSDGGDAIDDIEKLAGDASVIKLVNQIIIEAYKKRATDIHIEPHRGGVGMRYRIDGLLYDANPPAGMKNFLNAIISRIKIMSNLNIVERRLPQDGRAVVKVQDHVLDLRVSTIPTPHGESLVIRLLPTQMLFSLEKLGLSKQDMQLFDNLIQKPHGVVFVTGPTGSGKSTTLYTCLSKINTKDRKIITIEDPIEYEMQGIAQIQVMPEIGLDFAKGLRSILRHDPDVIMVGEVRDLETAEIAIRVALTGHLVFSTLHTNDAPSGVTRLIDIGVEPYLLVSSVEAFIAQRLIRVICQDCKYEDTDVPETLKTVISKESGIRVKDIKIFKGKGCAKCNNTGFFGRSAIYEIFMVDDFMKDLILQQASAAQLKKAAILKGMHTLRQDGWQKVISGITTPEEILDITSTEELSPKDDKGVDSGNSSMERMQKNTDPLDKRAYPRLDISIPIQYKAVKSQKEILARGIDLEHMSITKNVSAGGLLFIADEPLQVGSILEIKIEPPEEEKPISCLARVIRAEEADNIRGYKISACFLDITGSDRARLNRYTESKLI